MNKITEKESLKNKDIEKALKQIQLILKLKDQMKNPNDLLKKKEVILGENNFTFKIEKIN